MKTTPSVDSPDREFGERLLFVIGTPRSGTTLLSRILGSHSQIYARGEPHLLSPLAHLGFYDNVDRAPFDHLQSSRSVKDFVADLPQGEEDYFDACRAYASTLYLRMLKTKGGGKSIFLDKTPANSLILPFITKLYPKARYVVLTRNPAAIICSYAKSFFDDDFAAAHRFNPILNRYVPRIAAFLREQPVSVAHLNYETLVEEPEEAVRKLLEFLSLPFEEGIIDYGEHAHDTRGLGDPLRVDREDRPVSSSIDDWARHLCERPDKLQFVRDRLASIEDEHLAVWGYPRATVFAALDRVQREMPEAATAKTRLPQTEWNAFLIQRKALRHFRRLARRPLIQKSILRLREYCDILLRG